MKKPTYRIASESQITGILHQVLGMVNAGIKGGPVVITLGRESKSAIQRSKYHAMITDIHQHQYRDKHFKVVKAFTVNWFDQEMKAMGTPLRHPGERAWDPVLQEWVSIRPSTEDFTKSEAAAFIEFLYATGCGYGVTWSEPALAVYAEYARAA